jgi:cyanophycinase
MSEEHARMSGTVALVGSGEYLPPIEDLDRVLLQRLGAPGRVAVLPTASAPDGGNVAENWQRMGVEHFTKLGANVAPVTVLTRADADSAAMAEQIAAANFVYLSGGKPRYLLETLRDTACWRAIQSVHAAGGVIAGCSAGAMALGEALFDFPQIWRTIPALGLASGVAVIPHFDELPGIISGRVGPASKTISTAGVEGNTALVVSADGEWRVEGHGGVTLFVQGHGHTRYTAGQVIPH